VRADVGKDAQLRAAVRKTLARWHGLDVLISNAAEMTYVPLLNLPPKEWDTLISVNMRALLRLCQLSLPHTQARINAVSPGALDTAMLWDNPNVKNDKRR
jgi:NAD(P)-dependent dehydrogenase (short-subunit alcohol dehydrogenase family)